MQKKPRDKQPRSHRPLVFVPGEKTTEGTLGTTLWDIAILNEWLKVFISLRLPTKALYLFHSKRLTPLGPVHLKIALKVSLDGQLEARELTHTQALLGILIGSRGATGHGKDLKIRSAASLFTLSLPLCIFVFEAFHDLCVVISVKKLKERVNYL